LPRRTEPKKRGRGGEPRNEKRNNDIQTLNVDVRLPPAASYTKKEWTDGQRREGRLVLFNFIASRVPPPGMVFILPSIPSMMEHTLRCNHLKCRKELDDHAVVTTCRYYDPANLI
jgi:hypothetical protein